MYGTLLWHDRALPPNIRLGWKWQEVANTLAYYNVATITAVKSFIVQAPGRLLADLLSEWIVMKVWLRSCKEMSWGLKTIWPKTIWSTDSRPTGIWWTGSLVKYYIYIYRDFVADLCLTYIWSKDIWQEKLWWIDICATLGKSHW